MQKIYNSVMEMVGRTPLVNLSRLAKKFKVKANILAKCEFYNPVFSVKDRVALKMIEKAEEAGLVREDTVFVEATSGNTGIGLAAVCAARGYKLVIIMPENMSQERIKLMRHFGAEVILTPAEDGMTGSINKAEILAEKNPAVLLLRQFENEANPDAHKFGTSIEILEDTGGDVDCLVSAVGTAGTVSGIASALRTYNPELYVAAVEPAEEEWNTAMIGAPSYSTTCPSVSATACCTLVSYWSNLSPHLALASSSLSHAVQQLESVHTSASGWAAFSPPVMR